MEINKLVPVFRLLTFDWKFCKNLLKYIYIRIFKKKSMSQWVSGRIHRFVAVIFLHLEVTSGLSVVIFCAFGSGLFVVEKKIC